MLVILGSTDISKHIVADSYDMDAAEEYKSWTDGNNREHRVITRSQVSGSFSVICSSKTITQDEFLQLLSDNTEDGELTITVFVNNKHEAETVTAFAKVTTTTHTDQVDIYKVDLEEC